MQSIALLSASLTGYGPRTPNPELQLNSEAKSVTMSTPSKISPSTWTLICNALIELNGADDYALWTEKFRNAIDFVGDDAEDHINSDKELKLGDTYKVLELQKGTDGVETLVRKDKAVTAAEERDWKTLDLSVLKVIKLRLGKEPMIHIKRAKTAREAWKILEQVYAPKGLTNEVFLIRQMFGMRAKDSIPMEEHIRKLTEIRNQMTTAGELISEPLFAVLHLVTLPDSWSAFVSTFNLTDIASLSTNHIRERILLEYQRRQQSDPAIALAARGQFGHTPNNTDRNNVCRYCKEPGHWVRECPKSKWNKRGTNSANTAGTSTAANVAANAATATARVMEVANLASAAEFMEDEDDIFDMVFVAAAKDQALVTNEARWIADLGAGVHVVTD